MRNKQKYIYAMQCNDFVKFGMSHRPEFRIKELQIGNPYKIILLLAVPYNSCHLIEKQIHHYFDGKRETGEWFRVDDAIRDFVKYLKNIEYELINRK